MVPALGLVNGNKGWNLAVMRMERQGGRGHNISKEPRGCLVIGCMCVDGWEGVSEGERRSYPLRSPGVGNGNPLQYSCLENSMGRGAWWATVQGPVKSQTRLSN